MTAQENPTQDDIRWFHSFELPDGHIINGIKPLDVLRREADMIFPASLVGKSVLDIGAWDGFFSYEAEKRGAEEVLATDHFCWSGPGWGTKDGFDFIHARLESKVRAHDIEVMGLAPEKFGTFDVVLFLGVLYHVTDILRHLEAAAAMTRELLVIETVTTLINDPLPVARFIDTHELGRDPTNFWAPNPALIRLMLKRFGFERVEMTPSTKPVRQHALSTMFARYRRKPAPYIRAVFHAWR